ncbi:HNH endonuclease [Neobacillus sp. NPDC093182]|uniref:HNH endonuclease n=1 Tax=Neobacillus sp. NPDC093182 TaxID=3364297 RepID=UPI00380F21C6
MNGGHEGDRYLSTHGYYVHRLIVVAFLGPIPKGNQVNHKNGRKRCNYLTNLELVTHSENIQHAFKSGAHDSWTLSNFEIERRAVINDMRKTNNYWAVYDENLKYIRSYPSQEDASKSIGVSRQTANNSFRLGRLILGQLYICMPSQYKQLNENVANRAIGEVCN